jgi:hypothetical protein
MHKLLAILLVAPSIALAAFDQSLPEFKKAVAESPLLFAAERDTLPKAYEAYIESRNKALNELLEIIKDPDPGRKEQQRQFVDRAEAMKSDLKKFSDAVGSPDKLSPTALSILNGITQREGRFIEALKNLKVAEQRDAIVEQRRRMIEMSDLLETKWKGILDLDNNLDQQEQQVAQDIQKTLEQAINTAASSRKNIQEQLKTVVSGIAGVGKQIPIEAIKQVAEMVDFMNKEWYARWLEAQNYIGQRIATYTSLARGEQGGVFVLFMDVRRDTDLFIRENGFDKAKERFAKAKDDLDRLSDYYSGSGPKADATEWSKLALEHINNHLKASEEAFNNFVRNHEKKFFGPLGPDVREEMLETQVWDRLENEQRRLDLEEKLRAWRGDTRGFFEVSLSGLSDVEKEWLQDQLKSSLENLSKQIQKFEDELTLRQLKDKLFNRKLLGDGLK